MKRQGGEVEPGDQLSQLGMAQPGGQPQLVQQKEQQLTAVNVDLLASSCRPQVLFAAPLVDH